MNGGLENLSENFKDPPLKFHCGLYHFARKNNLPVFDPIIPPSNTNCVQYAIKQGVSPEIAYYNGLHTPFIFGGRDPEVRAIKKAKSYGLSVKQYYEMFREWDKLPISVRDKMLENSDEIMCNMSNQLSGNVVHHILESNVDRRKCLFVMGIRHLPILDMLG
jgi:hypothetical protein